MKITLPHNTDRETARGKIEQLLTELSKRHAGMVDDLDQHWEGDELRFSFKARGLKASGSLAVTDEELVLKSKLPLMALPFESKIKSAIEKEAESLFRLA